MKQAIDAKQQSLDEAQQANAKKDESIKDAQTRNQSLQEDKAKLELALGQEKEQNEQLRREVEELKKNKQSTDK